MVVGGDVPQYAVQCQARGTLYLDGARRLTALEGHALPQLAQNAWHVGRGRVPMLGHHSEVSHARPRHTHGVGMEHVSSNVVDI